MTTYGLNNCSSNVFVLIVIFSILYGSFWSDQRTRTSVACNQHVLFEVLQDILVLKINEILLEWHGVWVEIRVTIISAIFLATTFPLTLWIKRVFNTKLIIISYFISSWKDVPKFRTDVDIPVGCLLYLSNSFLFELATYELLYLVLKFSQILSWPRILHLWSSWLNMSCLHQSSITKPRSS